MSSFLVLYSKFHFAPEFFFGFGWVVWPGGDPPDHPPPPPLDKHIPERTCVCVTNHPSVALQRTLPLMPSRRSLRGCQCSKDEHNEHSTCGKGQTGFGPDERLNEEWFGIYNTSYDSDKDYVITLLPRPIVSDLQVCGTVVAYGDRRRRQV